MPRLKTAAGKNGPRRSSELQRKIDALASEGYALIAAALTFAGVPRARQLRLVNNAIRSAPKVPATSESILQEFRDLSDLLLAWLKDLPYVDAGGRPKVLPIKGEGATFESLARQFLPTRRLKDAVDFACSNSNVATKGKDRVFFQGDPVVKFANNPVAALAQVISHLRNITKTVELNSRRKKETRLLERVVAFPLSAEQFEVFRELIKPSLNDLTDHGEHIMQSLAKQGSGKRTKTYTAGLGVYLYLREPELPRASSGRAIRRKRRSA